MTSSSPRCGTAEPPQAARPLPPPAARPQRGRSTPTLIRTPGLPRCPAAARSRFLPPAPFAERCPSEQSHHTTDTWTGTEHRRVIRRSNARETPGGFRHDADPPQNAVGNGLACTDPPGVGPKPWPRDGVHALYNDTSVRKVRLAHGSPIWPLTFRIRIGTVGYRGGVLRGFGSCPVTSPIPSGP